MQGGISNGENIVIRVAFKPTSTIGQEQATVSREGRYLLVEMNHSTYMLNFLNFPSTLLIIIFIICSGEETTIRGKGRHDPCVLPRAVPMVEAMVALVLLDGLMQQKAQNDLFSWNESFGNEPTDALREINPLGKKLNGFGANLK